MDNVAGTQVDLYGLVDREVKGWKRLRDVLFFAGELSLDAREVDLLVYVVEVPAPLLSNNRDRNIRVLILSLNGLHVASSKGEEAQNQNQWHDCEEGLDWHVVSKLRWHPSLALASAVDNQCPCHQCPRYESNS